MMLNPVLLRTLVQVVRHGSPSASALARMVTERSGVRDGASLVRS